MFSSRFSVAKGISTGQVPIYSFWHPRFCWGWFEPKQLFCFACVDRALILIIPDGWVRGHTHGVGFRRSALEHLRHCSRVLVDCHPCSTTGRHVERICRSGGSGPFCHYPCADVGDVAAASDPFVRRLLKASANKRRALASGAGELMSQQKDGAILVLLGGGTLSLAGRLAHEAAAAAAAVVAVVFCTGQHRSRQSHAELGRRPQRTCSRVVHKAPAGNLPSKRVGAHLGHRTSSREEREPREK